MQTGHFTEDLYNDGTKPFFHNMRSLARRLVVPASLLILGATDAYGGTIGNMIERANQVKRQCIQQLEHYREMEKSVREGSDDWRFYRCMRTVYGSMTEYLDGFVYHVSGFTDNGDAILEARALAEARELDEDMSNKEHRECSRRSSRVYITENQQNKISKVTAVASTQIPSPSARPVIVTVKPMQPQHDNAIASTLLRHALADGDTAFVKIEYPRVVTDGNFDINITFYGSPTVDVTKGFVYVAYPQCSMGFGNSRNSFGSITYYNPNTKAWEAPRGNIPMSIVGKNMMNLFDEVTTFTPVTDLFRQLASMEHATLQFVFDDNTYDTNLSSFDTGGAYELSAGKRVLVPLHMDEKPDRRVEIVYGFGGMNKRTFIGFGDIQRTSIQVRTPEDIRR